VLETLEIEENPMSQDNRIIIAVAPVRDRAMTMNEQRSIERLRMMHGGTWRIPAPMMADMASAMVTSGHEVDVLVLLGPGHRELAIELLKLSRDQGRKLGVFIVTDESIEAFGDPVEMVDKIIL